MTKTTPNKSFSFPSELWFDRKLSIWAYENRFSKARIQLNNSRSFLPDTWKTQIFSRLWLFFLSNSFVLLVTDNHIKRWLLEKIIDSLSDDEVFARRMGLLFRFSSASALKYKHQHTSLSLSYDLLLRFYCTLRISCSGWKMRCANPKNVLHLAQTHTCTGICTHRTGVIP